MLLTSIIIPVLTLVIVFLFSIQKFSNQIQRVAGERFKKTMETVTKTPIRGIFAGTFFTSIIQSSTATTVILVGLVNAGLITFSNSIGVILGANIGTTVTSQLVALHLTNIAPYFVLVGFFVSYFGKSYKHWGKPIFYFGLVFFSLSLISLYIEPVKSDPSIIGLFSHINNVYVAIIVGMLFTAVIQSSSVTSGLVILFAGAGLLTFNQSLGVIFGANIGTTVTALLASAQLGVSAKRVAMAHFLFNVLGVMIFLPFIGLFGNLVNSFGGSPQQMVANAHLLFNILSAILFLVFIVPFERLVNYVVVAK